MNKRKRLVSYILLSIIAIIPLVLFWPVIAEYWKRIFGDYQYPIPEPKLDVAIFVYVILALGLNGWEIFRIQRGKHPQWYIPVITILVMLGMGYGILPVRFSGNYCQFNDKNVQEISRTLQQYYATHSRFPETDVSSMKNDKILDDLDSRYRVDSFSADSPNSLYVYLNDCKLLVYPERYEVYPRR